MQRLNGWPLDFVGYFGLLHHDERGLQPDSWQFNAYVKGYWYGFPWSDRVRTRVGFGTGLSYAQRIPYVEARDQAQRGRGTSHLLNYLDPSIDVSIGDLLGRPSLREAYFGFGVTHRSGNFRQLAAVRQRQRRLELHLHLRRVAALGGGRAAGP